VLGGAHCWCCCWWCHERFMLLLCCCCYCCCSAAAQKSNRPPCKPQPTPSHLQNVALLIQPARLRHVQRVQHLQERGRHAGARVGLCGQVLRAVAQLEAVVVPAEVGLVAVASWGSEGGWGWGERAHQGAIWPGGSAELEPAHATRPRAACSRRHGDAVNATTRPPGTTHSSWLLVGRDRPPPPPARPADGAEARLTRCPPPPVPWLLPPLRYPASSPPIHSSSSSLERPLLRRIAIER